MRLNPKGWVALLLFSYFACMVYVACVVMHG